MVVDTIIFDFIIVFAIRWERKYETKRKKEISLMKRKKGLLRKRIRRKKMNNNFVILGSFVNLH